MNFIDEMNDNYLYYSEKGEKLKIFYTLDDFLNNPYTKNILVDEWDNLFRINIEEPILNLNEDEKLEQENLGTNLFRKDRGGQFEGELIGEIYNYVKPKYDLEIFFNNPELAKNFDT